MSRFAPAKASKTLLSQVCLQERNWSVAYLLMLSALVGPEQERSLPPRTELPLALTSNKN